MRLPHWAKLMHFLYQWCRISLLNLDAPTGVYTVFSFKVWQFKSDAGQQSWYRGKAIHSGKKKLTALAKAKDGTFASLWSNLKSTLKKKKRADIVPGGSLCCSRHLCGSFYQPASDFPRLWIHLKRKSNNASNFYVHPLDLPTTEQTPRGAEAYLFVLEDVKVRGMSDSGRLSVS